ncbi:MAG: Hsp20/alpha crystallin family protein [Alkalispirochaeta sp.]
MSKDVQTRENRDVATEGRQDENRRPRIYPTYEVWERNGEIHLRLEMPGLTRDDVTITVENNQLTISGSRPDWSVDGTVLIRERRVGDYYRFFTLDKTVDTGKIEATMKNGVLDITLAVAKEAQPRRIEIKSS